MKNRYNNFLKWMFGGGAICVFSSIPITLIATELAKNDFEKALGLAFLMIFPIALAYLTIIVVKFLQYTKYEKQENKKTLEKAQSELTSEFKKVRMNNSCTIQKKLLECQAKIDTDGKIICKVQLDYETKFDSYEEFLRFFNLDDNS